MMKESTEYNKKVDEIKRLKYEKAFLDGVCNGKVSLTIILLAYRLVSDRFDSNVQSMSGEVE